MGLKSRSGIPWFVFGLLIERSCVSFNRPRAQAAPRDRPGCHDSTRISPGLQRIHEKVRSGSSHRDFGRESSSPSFRESELPTIGASELTEFATDLFVAVGVPADDARVVAQSLVGVESQGARLARRDAHPPVRGLPRAWRVQDRRRPGRRARDPRPGRLRRPLGARPGPGAPAARPAHPQGQGPGRRGRDDARLRAHRPAGRVCRTRGRRRDHPAGDGQQLRIGPAGRPARGNRATARHQSSLRGAFPPTGPMRPSSSISGPASSPKARSASTTSTRCRCPTAGSSTTKGIPPTTRPCSTSPPWARSCPWGASSLTRASAWH